MFLIPKKNTIVRDVDHGRRILPECGAEVEWSVHWQRRINEGAVTVGKPAAADASPAPAAPKTPPSPPAPVAPKVS
jgi:hypothetical protein